MPITITSTEAETQLIERKLLVTDPWYELISQMLSRVITDFEGKTILEIGCGIGGFCLRMAQMEAKVIGLDISQSAIKKAKQLAQKHRVKKYVDFIIGDAQYLPFKDQSGDVVICSETLEHVQNSQLAFNELIRATQKSGYLCITVPNLFSIMFLEFLVLFAIGQPQYARNFLSVEKEHIFHIKKVTRMLDNRSLNTIEIRGADLLHLPPRIKKALKIEHYLKIISNKLLEHFPTLGVLCATIGVLARRK